ncbi:MULTISPECIES: hypothetical protein [unclassified Pseudomonas]|uniref:hypothetical protein n=1 Tax=unclassified Pseudomonas TaxID=196821 RepID=UPI000D3CDB60|nr:MULTISPECIES: hypothetical protein [unclassified Pseudomonas]RAU49532.1 hypothetical protein DBP26_001600 [Pseudomonas sp. RIT 409]RAU55729.1 hypothetical protein DBY65_000920 [Pseudomonas sp. RIT 412]
MKKNNFKIIAGQIFINENRITTPHPVSEALEKDNLVIVRVDPPAGVIFNRNVYGITANGEILWQIQASLHGTQQDKPYTNILLNPDGLLIAENWNGVSYSVDIRNGEITTIAFDK